MDNSHATSIARLKNYGLAIITYIPKGNNPPGTRSAAKRALKHRPLHRKHKHGRHV